LAERVSLATDPLVEQMYSPSISMAWNMVGEQAGARSTSAEISAFRKMRPRPVRALVAVMKSFIDERAS